MVIDARDRFAQRTASMLVNDLNEEEGTERMALFPPEYDDRVVRQIELGLISARPSLLQGGAS